MIYVSRQKSFTSRKKSEHSLSTPASMMSALRFPRRYGKDLTA